ncbi:hypothetical protein G7070_07035 [Propioniciclava coleopterorum]|uniref:Fructose-1,6-bisphosphatase n=1 Tax=Propioniciclava coleopterorum TaxID=2714937 RepID=A0A6G7Y5H5_9ACTN|nr:hypothetical protein [Propioniciclava coleopterorum]QIK72065.1 hypothetical protein G7070_07035 [Propioniciclava coleopterorum]
MSDLHRFHHDASLNERIAYALAHAGFIAVRRAELLQTYGRDIQEAEALGNSVAAAQSPSDVDAALEGLRNRKVQREDQLASGLNLDLYYEGFAESVPDFQGEAAIGYDIIAWTAMEYTARTYGNVEILGEEDQFRPLQDGPTRRGEYLRKLLREGRRVAVVDPLDGSNQARAMGMRSGWATCAMVLGPQQRTIAAAVYLGDGRTVVTAGDDGVWASEPAHPDRPTVAYRLDPLARQHPTFARRHWTIPAAKAKTIEHAVAMIEASKNEQSEPPVSWVNPLAGNPGFVTSMLYAGAVAAMQPESYAWDALGPYLVAVAGLPTISAESDEMLTPEELSDMLITDLMAGRRTMTLYSGRTLKDARYLRSIDRAATDARKRMGRA